MLQWKLDIRSRSLLLTCYVVPLLFFAVVGAIFTSMNPEAKYTIIQSMTVLGVTTGAIVGLSPTLSETYGSDIKKVYKANGVPLYLGVVTMLISTFIHISIMSAIIYITAPIAFDAVLPKNLGLYIGSLAVFIVVSLSIGSVLGLAVKNNAKLTMISQIIFLPSMMLSGIMFPTSLLPRPLEIAGRFFPATWGYQMMTGDGFRPSELLPLTLLLAAAVIVCGSLLKKMQSE